MLPHADLGAMRTLLGAALAIAALAAIESLLSARVARDHVAEPDRTTRTVSWWDRVWPRSPPGVFGGMPATGAHRPHRGQRPIRRQNAGGGDRALGCPAGRGLSGHRAGVRPFRSPRWPGC